jgi:hypothetical protein
VQATAEKVVENVIAGSDPLKEITDGPEVGGGQGAAAPRGRGMGSQGSADEGGPAEPGASRPTALSRGEGGGKRAGKLSGLVKVSTMTVDRPTAAEQTMQPANMRENSWRSLAACMSCRAQATKAMTEATMRMANQRVRGRGNPKRAVTAGI